MPPLIFKNWNFVCCILLLSFIGVVHGKAIQQSCQIKRAGMKKKTFCNLLYVEDVYDEIAQMAERALGKKISSGPEFKSPLVRCFL